jgi:hypothetical protein
MVPPPVTATRAVQPPPSIQSQNPVYYQPEASFPNFGASQSPITNKVSPVTQPPIFATPQPSVANPPPAFTRLSQPPAYIPPPIDPRLQTSVATAKDVSTNGIYKVFRSDSNLTSQEISEFLGIDTSFGELKEEEIPDASFHYDGILVWFISFIIAAAGLLFYMYTYKIGVFHPTVGITFFNEL